MAQKRRRAEEWRSYNCDWAESCMEVKMENAVEPAAPTWNAIIAAIR